MPEPDVHWRERVKAIGAAQARYLWVLLILMLFYAALQLQTVSPPGKASARVPILDLEISSILVLSSATAVLSLVVLALAGSMRALRRAREQGLGESTGEEFDLHPNVIDLAFYAPPGSAGLFVHLARSVYALFLTIGLAEGLWLAPYMSHVRLPASYVVAVTLIGTLLLIRAAVLTGRIWERCMRDYLN
ncbi:MAG: hypothetical protein HY725_09885 [Candidatus Rokubacteria bacterium]|nr:hypothetical protein [Candidatus Rokubacteria bacterium]